MTLLLHFLFFLIGLFLIIKGSAWLIDSAVWAAEVFHIPPLIVGTTVISICTTLPETFVSVTAAMEGEPAMAAGNAIGSIGVNTGFILAILLLHAIPSIDNRKEYLLNGFFLISILMILWGIGLFYGRITPLTGFFLLIMLALFILSNIRFARKAMDLDIQYDFIDEENLRGTLDLENSMPDGVSYDESENDFDISIQTASRKLIFFVIGVAFIVIGSRTLVDHGIEIATLIHVPTFLIAVIFTSIGTSLPELVTVITSARKGASTIGIGTVIGADILNIVQVIGVTAFLSPTPLPYDRSTLLFQLPLITIMVLFAVLPGAVKRPARWNGIILFLLYLLFLIGNILRESMPILGQYIF